MNIKEYLNKNTNTTFLLSMLVALAVIIFISVTWLLPNDQTKPTDDTEPVEIEWRCLREDEAASYTKSKKEDGTNLVTITIKDKETEKEISSFQIDNVFTTRHSVKLYKCGAYATREFNFDEKKFKPLRGFNRGLWKYDYNGNGKERILFTKETNSGEIEHNYSPNFRVSPSEQYVVLERGYGGSDDYALIIKDLNTLEDVFILPAQERFEKDPNITGTLGLMEWTKDSRYFWGDIFMGAYTSGYFRIDIENQTYELFEAPEGQMGGDQLNTETGWVTNHSGIFWTGIHEFTEQLKEEMREDGIGTKLYIYNLFTEEKILIYETEEPDWYTKPWWISETELRYETFEGETKVYEIIE